MLLEACAPSFLYAESRNIMNSSTPQIFEDFMLSPNDLAQDSLSNQAHQLKELRDAKISQDEQVQEAQVSETEKSICQCVSKKKAPRPFEVVGGYLILRHVRVMPSHHTRCLSSQWPKSDPGTGANVSSGSAGCRSYQCLEMNGLCHKRGLRSFFVDSDHRCVVI